MPMPMPKIVSMVRIFLVLNILVDNLNVSTTLIKIICLKKLFREIFKFNK